MAGVYGWDECEELAEKDGGGDFRRLEDDEDFCIGVFLGAPYGRRLHWDQAAGQFHECEATKDDPACVYCDDGLNLSKKFWINFVTLATGTGDSNEKRKDGPGVVEVLELSSRGIKQVLRAKAKYRGLDSWTFEVKRQGAKGDTETTYTVLPDTQISELDEATAALIEGAEPVELKQLAARLNAGGDDDSDDKPRRKAKPRRESKPKADAAIDAQTAGELSARLRALDKPDAIGLMKKFGIRKLAELKQSQFAKFVQELSELEGADDDDDDTFDF